MIELFKITRGLLVACLISLTLAFVTGYEPGRVELTVYSQKEVDSMGKWEGQGDNTYKFKLNTGEYLKNSWVASLSENDA